MAHYLSPNEHIKYAHRQVISMDVAARLKQLMDERHWTMYKLAQEADVPWSTINNFYRRRSEPSISTLQYLCEGLGITLAQFFDTGERTDVSAEQQYVLERWSRLDADERRVIGDMMDALLNAHERAGQGE